MTEFDDDYDEEDTYEVDCPHCGETIYEGIDQCPYCRNFLSAADFKKPLPKWIVIVLILTIASFLIPTLLQLLEMVTKAS